MDGRLVTFFCTCTHANHDHNDRIGQGPWRCSVEGCGCEAFTWDEGAG
jgi:hypothetical protein